MSINFGARKEIWHQFGTELMAKSVEEALNQADLNWNVEKREISLMGSTDAVKGVSATVRADTSDVLGIVSNKYSIIQNRDAFAFIDDMMGKNDYTITRAGMFNNGGAMWMLVEADEIDMHGDKIKNNAIFVNSHNGTSSFKMAMIPMRIACSNAINYALRKAKRVMAFSHIGDVSKRAKLAMQAQGFIGAYSTSLQQEIARLERVSFSPRQVKQAIEILLPLGEEDGDVKRQNVADMRDDLAARYLNAPDLSEMSQNANRFLYAVSDFATHRVPNRETKTYKENLFSRSITGNAIIDKAYEIVNEAA